MAPWKSITLLFLLIGRASAQSSGNAGGDIVVGEITELVAVAGVAVGAALVVAFVIIGSRQAKQTFHDVVEESWEPDYSKPQYDPRGRRMTKAQMYRASRRK